MKALPYGVIAFLVAVFLLHAVTSPNWNSTPATVNFHVVRILAAAAIGIGLWHFINSVMKRKSELESVLRATVLYPLGAGVFLACLWIGIGGFQFMGSSDLAVVSVYRAGMILGIWATSTTLILSLINLRINRQNRAHLRRQ